MRLKGVCYDVGRDLGFNWRPDFQPAIVQRELEVIQRDLHCTAVRICGLDIDRVMLASEKALALGLEVWISPEMWDRTPDRTLRYLVRAATAAEPLRQRWPDRVVLSVGSELTLFMRGIVPGRTYSDRTKDPQLFDRLRAREHVRPLNQFLGRATRAVREVYHGPLSYAALIWEGVDWTPFDRIGVDHYRIRRIEDRYVEMLEPVLRVGKPVVVTEFGYAACATGIGSEGMLGNSGLGADLIDRRSQALHQLPVIGRWIRPRLRGSPVRNEAWQARKLVEQLRILDSADVDGGFIFQFLSQITPSSDDPRFDVDLAATSLVQYYEGRRRGRTYPDLPWEPKQAFHAVADYYANH